jgi:hypothetical protein
MSKNLLFKILIIFWALALIVVGIIYYKNNESCSTCKSNPEYADFFSSLTKEQKTKLSSRKAVILIPEKSDPIYVNENVAYSNAQLTTFSYEQPNPPTQDELKNIITNILHRKYLDKMPQDLRSLYSERKLAILQSKSGDFFIVALKEYLEGPFKSDNYSQLERR